MRAIFAVRALPALLRGRATCASSKPLLAETLALGWRILAERPDRDLVLGAVTQPWKAEVRFRGVDPETFGEFAEPGYAKIVWTLEAIPLGPTVSRFRTQTRVPRRIRDPGSCSAGIGPSSRLASCSSDRCR